MTLVRLLRARRAAVAVWVAMLAPVLTTAVSLSMEVSNWAVVQVDVQGQADTAAIAGALNYKSTGNAQTAATAAARMAQLNGAQGTAIPTWNSGTSTLSDNMVTAQVTTGAKSSSDTAIKVTVQQTVPLTLSKMFSDLSSVTITGTSMAELVTTTSAGTGGQPCLLALSSGGSITGAGSTNISMPNCTIRSNGTIGIHGGGNVSTGGIYAGGAISIDAWIPTTGGQYPSDGTISDPYASNTTLQSALTTAAGLTGVTNVNCTNTGCSPALPNGSACTFGGSVTCTMKPGNYGSFALSGGPYTFTWNPGLYLFKGNVNFSGSTSSSGSGVTIITAGTFTGQNTFAMTLSAPSTSAAASTGGIAGIALAGNTTGTVTLSGSDTFTITGVVYFPNATFDASGSSGLGISTTSCLEIIAASIKLTGSSYFNSSCSSVNAAGFSSVPGTSTTNASIVQ
jgi:hypothetical protein